MRTLLYINDTVVVLIMKAFKTIARFLQFSIALSHSLFAVICSFILYSSKYMTYHAVEIVADP